MNLIPSIHHQPEPSLRRAFLGWLMRIANSYPLHLWYENKARLLEYYGEPDGFDLQSIEAVCWNCEGAGCCDCGDTGIHHTTRTVLVRRWVGTCMFHTPMGRWREDQFPTLIADPQFRRHITRRITHRPTDPRAAREAVAAIVMLCGYYRTWFRMISSRYYWETEGTSFPVSKPGLYPQHLLACTIHRIKNGMESLKLRLGFDDVPF